MNRTNSHIVSVTKIFSFEMAHLISTHKGGCSSLHGHSYELHVTLKGEIKNDSQRADYGMVMDFAELKEIVNRAVINQFDHACVISKSSGIKANKELGDKIIYADYEPTCEELVCDFAERIKTLLPNKNLLHKVRLWETKTSYAEWLRADNS